LKIKIINVWVNSILVVGIWFQIFTLFYLSRSIFPFRKPQAVLKKITGPTDLYYKDRTLSFSLKSRRAHARNRIKVDRMRWRNARSAKYDRFSQEYVVLLQLCEKLYTYECIDTVLFCAAKVLIYENTPIERCDA
jgi:hypothetical protein